MFRKNIGCKVKYVIRLGTVAHAYNPRYLGGKDGEDHG
jgi:hypothetical protein